MLGVGGTWKVRNRGQTRGDYRDIGADWMGNIEKAIKDDAQVGSYGDLVDGRCHSQR